MATQTTTKPLRTFDILGLYFIYGIQVQFIGTGKRFPLLGLDRQHWSVKYHASKSYEDPEMLLPVLRPFSELWGLLPDGTTPAIEFAKLCLGEEVELENATVFYEPGEEDEEFGDTEETIEVRGEDNGKQLVFTIYPDWTWYGYGESDNCAPAAAIDYLRSKHFAVNLQPHQFIAK